MVDRDLEESLDTSVWCEGEGEQSEGNAGQSTGKHRPRCPLRLGFNVLL